MTKRVLIVGAGPGGLAAAMLLAKAGLAVEVLERAPQVGGRTTTLETPEGFRFDVGPTFFLFPEILQEIYHACGADLFRAVPMKRLDPQYRLEFGGGGRLDAVSDIAEMERRIAAISPQDAGGFTRFLRDNRGKLDAFRPILQSPWEKWTDLFSPKMLAMLPLVKPWKSLERELAGYFKDPRIRLAFSFQSKYLGMSPFQCPSLFSILSFLEYEYGVFHPIGGCGAVTRNMARQAQALGAEVRVSTPVEEILFEGRKAVGVRTAAGERRADAVVVNADFAQAMRSLVPNRLRRRWNDSSLAKKKYSCSTFMLYLGLEGLDEQVPHHTIYMARDYEKNLREIETEHVLSEDPSFYVQNACVTDSTLAPPGCSTLYVLAPTTHQHQNVDWSVEAPKFRERLLDRLERIGVKDVRKRIRYEKMVTPHDWEHQFHIYKGATFNLAHSLLQMLHLRPHNRFEEFQNMYLVGGGTHPGSGLPVIFESARISSRLLLADFGLETAWLQPGKFRPQAGKPQAQPAELVGTAAAVAPPLETGPGMGVSQPLAGAE